MQKKDSILIADLELSAHIGVPDLERAEMQRLTLNLTLSPCRGFSDLGDDIQKTVDYFVLTRQVRKLAAERPRKLIETLAEEIAAFVLREFPLAEVEVELRKYILPDTAFVGVRVHRSAAENRAG